MTAAIVVTIVVVTVTILVLALYLLRIALMLKRTLSGLRKVNRSLKAIPSKTDPVEPILRALSSDLGDARKLLEDLVNRKRQAPAPAAAAPVRPPGPGVVG